MRRQAGKGISRAAQNFEVRGQLRGNFKGRPTRRLDVHATFEVSGLSVLSVQASASVRHPQTLIL